jgi:MerR family transcriptional regulator, thiopeptide resistance regulator
MSKKKTNKPIIKPHSEKKQKHYERVARLQYGPDSVNESIKRWNSYSKEQQDAIFAESGQIYTELVEALEAGLPAQNPEVQLILQRWHENMRHFFEPTPDILRGIGEGYHNDPEFKAFFDKLHPELSAYLSEGITQYVDDLEYAEIVRMLAEDEEQNKNQNTKVMYQYKTE